MADVVKRARDKNRRSSGILKVRQVYESDTDTYTASVCPSVSFAGPTLDRKYRRVSFAETDEVREFRVHAIEPLSETDQTHSSVVEDSNDVIVQPTIVPRSALADRADLLLQEKPAQPGPCVLATEQVCLASHVDDEFEPDDLNTTHICAGDISADCERLEAAADQLDWCPLENVPRNTLVLEKNNPDPNKTVIFGQCGEGDNDMSMTRCYTGSPTPLDCTVSLALFDRTKVFSCGDDDMEMTRCQQGNHAFDTELNQSQQRHVGNSRQNVQSLVDSTKLFTSGADDMEMTSCFSKDIGGDVTLSGRRPFGKRAGDAAPKMPGPVVQGLQPYASGNVNQDVTSICNDGVNTKALITSDSTHYKVTQKNESGMTVNDEQGIVRHDPNKTCVFVPRDDEMEVTCVVDGIDMNASVLQPKPVEMCNLPSCLDVTKVFGSEDADMEMTEHLEGAITLKHTFSCPNEATRIFADRASMEMTACIDNFVSGPSNTSCTNTTVKSYQHTQESFRNWEMMDTLTFDTSHISRLSDPERTHLREPDLRCRGRLSVPLLDTSKVLAELRASKNSLLNLDKSSSSCPSGVSVPSKPERCRPKSCGAAHSVLLDTKLIMSELGTVKGVTSDSRHSLLAESKKTPVSMSECLGVSENSQVKFDSIADGAPVAPLHLQTWNDAPSAEKVLFPNYTLRKSVGGLACRDAIPGKHIENRNTVIISEAAAVQTASGVSQCSEMNFHPLLPTKSSNLSAQIQPPSVTVVDESDCPRSCKSVLGSKRPVVTSPSADDLLNEVMMANAKRSRLTLGMENIAECNLETVGRIQSAGAQVVEMHSSASTDPVQVNGDSVGISSETMCPVSQRADEVHLVENGPDVMQESNKLAANNELNILGMSALDQKSHTADNVSLSWSVLPPDVTSVTDLTDSLRLSKSVLPHEMTATSLSTSVPLPVVPGCSTLVDASGNVTSSFPQTVNKPVADCANESSVEFVGAQKVSMDPEIDVSMLSFAMSEVTGMVSLFNITKTLAEFEPDFSTLPALNPVPSCPALSISSFEPSAGTTLQPDMSLSSMMQALQGQPSYADGTSSGSALLGKPSGIDVTTELSVLEMFDKSRMGQEKSASGSRSSVINNSKMSLPDIMDVSDVVFRSPVQEISAVVDISRVSNMLTDENRDVTTNITLPSFVFGDRSRHLSNNSNASFNPVFPVRNGRQSVGLSLSQQTPSKYDWLAKQSLPILDDVSVLEISQELKDCSVVPPLCATVSLSQSANVSTTQSAATACPRLETDSNPSSPSGMQLSVTMDKESDQMQDSRSRMAAESSLLNDLNKFTNNVQQLNQYVEDLESLFGRRRDELASLKARSEQLDFELNEIATERSVRMKNHLDIVHKRIRYAEEVGQRMRAVGDADRSIGDLEAQVAVRHEQLRKHHEFLERTATYKQVSWDWTTGADFSLLDGTLLLSLVFGDEVESKTFMGRPARLITHLSLNSSEPDESWSPDRLLAHRLVHEAVNTDVVHHRCRDTTHLPEALQFISHTAIEAHRLCDDLARLDYKRLQRRVQIDKHRVCVMFSNITSFCKFYLCCDVHLPEILQMAPNWTIDRNIGNISENELMPVINTVRPGINYLRDVFNAVERFLDCRPASRPKFCSGFYPPTKSLG